MLAGGGRAQIDDSIDALVKLSAASSGNEVRDAFACFARAVLDERGSGAESDVSTALFAASHAPGDAHFIAVCLLRAWNGRPTLLEELSIKRQAIALFDAAFGPEVYPTLGIEVRAQSFEKERVLVDAVRRAEEDLSDCIANLTSLAELDGARRDLSGRLAKPLPRALFRSFVKRQLVEGRLQDVFRAANEYRTSESANKVSAYESAMEVLSTYETEIDAEPTTYSESFLRPLAAKIRDLLQDDFLEDDVNKPVSVGVRPATKRYALNRVGSEIDLRLQVFTDGPGIARDVSIEVVAEGMDLAHCLRNVGDLRRAASEISFPATVTSACSCSTLLAIATWRDGRGISHSADFEIVVSAQNPVDWERASRLEPYSLEAVRTEDKLIGRRQLLNELIRTAGSPSPGSAFLFGQKRIGKTSIARALVSHCQQMEDDDVFAVYVDMSGVRSSDPLRTVRNLGVEVGEEMRRQYARFSAAPLPECTESLRPLARYIDSLRQVAPLGRFTIVIDEFDEIPIELFKRGSLGDTFFASLRHLTEADAVHVILVGGERMNAIIDSQGTRLNKFETLPVDYFSRERDWEDYTDLVRAPASGVLDISDGAISSLYDITGGHPFFTKLVCGRLYEWAVERRDSDITSHEIDLAVAAAVERAQQNYFAHFWEDGIVESDDRAREVTSMRRRKVLLALGDFPDAAGMRDEVAARTQGAFGVVSQVASDELESLIGRRVLVADGDVVRPKVPMFGRWLQARGRGDVSVTYTDVVEIDEYLATVSPDAIPTPAAVILEGAPAAVEPVRFGEMDRIVRGWGTFNGSRVSAEQGLEWIRQFGDSSSQRLMLPVLEGLTYFDEAWAREKVRVAHRSVRAGTHQVFESARGAEPTRSQAFVVTYLGGDGKSGARVARLYAEENNIHRSRNVFGADRLEARVRVLGEVQAIVMVEDFVGTGASLESSLDLLARDAGDWLSDVGVPTYLVVLAAFRNGASRVQKALERLRLPMKLQISEELSDERERTFGGSSRFYPDEVDRERARSLAVNIGERLEPRTPLGYGDLQAAVVFDWACPNNTLPILRKRSGDWVPLFERAL